LRCLLGDLLARPYPAHLIQAEASYREALTSAQDLRMRPLQAHCHLGLGQIHAQAKEPAKARAELLEAAELYRVMSIPFWLSKAESALAELS